VFAANIDQDKRTNCTHSTATFLLIGTQQVDQEKSTYATNTVGPFLLNVFHISQFLTFPVAGSFRSGADSFRSGAGTDFFLKNPYISLPRTEFSAYHLATLVNPLVKL